MPKAKPMPGTLFSNCPNPRMVYQAPAVMGHTGSWSWRMDTNTLCSIARTAMRHWRDGRSDRITSQSSVFLQALQSSIDMHAYAVHNSATGRDSWHCHDNSATEHDSWHCHDNSATGPGPVASALFVAGICICICMHVFKGQGGDQVGSTGQADHRNLRGIARRLLVHFRERNTNRCVCISGIFNDFSRPNLVTNLASGSGCQKDSSPIPVHTHTHQAVHASAFAALQYGVEDRQWRRTCLGRPLLHERVHVWQELRHQVSAGAPPMRWRLLHGSRDIATRDAEAHYGKLHAPTMSAHPITPPSS